VISGDERYTTDEMMAVAAARHLDDGTVCFVGIGLPSQAANLARATHAPRCVLIYESGTIGAKPARLPLSIGDGELADTADAVVSVPEIFSYWLQAGRITIGFLSAAQIDRYGNLNTTVVGGTTTPLSAFPARAVLQRSPRRAGRRWSCSGRTVAPSSRPSTSAPRLATARVAVPASVSGSSAVASARW
jgi:Coenzyme A transferase